jgi:hypothetical protein
MAQPPQLPADVDFRLPSGPGAIGSARIVCVVCRVL